ncbi:uncharacterized protein LOC118122855 isoform X2 [Hippoglossus stenolepis]|uniref:uncharacterized protein LOC118122855 isoform X2 n=1 Tax=Hippoglossus stenolepis TaxID=195615 RepID=UPI00159C4F2F|nr:uncharacterized protein LOC118122855 isoform X2 [Hippoglossus stenolepis]
MFPAQEFCVSVSVIVSMSAVGLKLVTLLCFSCTALSVPERCQVVWKKAGETTTIECRMSDRTDGYLDLCRGVCEDDKVIYAESKKVDIVPAFRGRVHTNGAYPNVDISIVNLTSADTALYWCVYKKFDEVTGSVIKTSGGSVVLVVTDGGGSANGNQACETDHQKLLLVAVVIAGVVLFGFILGACIWIILKTKTYRLSVKPRRVPNNEVYEDMRSTIRR